MEKWLQYLAFGFIASMVSCGSNDVGKNSSSTEEAPQEKVEIPGYDSTKAAKFGADDFGMKQYVMAFLKAGPNRDMDSTEAMKLQMAHLENITRLAEEGDLVLAGPFLDTGSVRGIYVFDVRTVEEARILTKTDPAIQAGSLTMELRPWYGSAALMEVNAIHETIQRKSITGE